MNEKEYKKISKEIKKLDSSEKIDILLDSMTQFQYDLRTKQELTENDLKQLLARRTLIYRDSSVMEEISDKQKNDLDNDIYHYIISYKNQEIAKIKQVENEFDKRYTFINLLNFLYSYDTYRLLSSIGTVEDLENLKTELKNVEESENINVNQNLYNPEIINPNGKKKNVSKKIIAGVLLGSLALGSGYGIYKVVTSSSKSQSDEIKDDNNLSAKDLQIKEATEAVELAEKTEDIKDINAAKRLVDALNDEWEEKKELNDRLIKISYSFNLSNLEEVAKIGAEQANIINEAMGENLVSAEEVIAFMFYTNAKDITKLGVMEEWSNVIGYMSPEEIRDTYSNMFHKLAPAIFLSTENNIMSPFMASKADSSYLVKFENLIMEYNKELKSGKGTDKSVKALSDALDELYEQDFDSFGEKNSVISQNVLEYTLWIINQFPAEIHEIKNHKVFDKMNLTGKETCTEEEKTTIIQDLFDKAVTENKYILKNLTDIIKTNINNEKISYDELVVMINELIIKVEKELDPNSTGNKKVDDMNQAIINSGEKTTEVFEEQGATYEKTPSGKTVIVPKGNKVTEKEKEVFKEQSKTEVSKSVDENKKDTGTIIDNVDYYKLGWTQADNDIVASFGSKSIKKTDLTNKSKDYVNGYNAAIANATKENGVWYNHIKDQEKAEKEDAKLQKELEEAANAKTLEEALKEGSKEVKEGSSTPKPKTEVEYSAPKDVKPTTNSTTQKPATNTNTNKNTTVEVTVVDSPVKSEIGKTVTSDKLDELAAEKENLYNQKEELTEILASNPDILSSVGTGKIYQDANGDWVVDYEDIKAAAQR